MTLAESENDPKAFLDEYNSSALVSVSSEVKKNGMVNPKVTHQEFLKDLNTNYLTRRQTTWDAIQSKVHKSIAKLFYAVAPSLSSFQEGRSKELCAVYGVDVLLKDSLEPLIIGVDPSPRFDSQKCFSDVLVTAFGQNGECLESVDISQVCAREK